jgi:hypothetical protein
MSRFIQALATSIAMVLRPGGSAPVTSIRHGAVHTTPKSTPLTSTRARSSGNGTLQTPLTGEV